MRGGRCVTCCKHFKYSAYWYKMKKSDPPVDCWACRLQKRNEERIKLGGKASDLV